MRDWIAAAVGGLLAALLLTVSDAAASTPTAPHDRCVLEDGPTEPGGCPPGLEVETTVAETAAGRGTGWRTGPASVAVVTVAAVLLAVVACWRRDGATA